MISKDDPGFATSLAPLGAILLIAAATAVAIALNVNPPTAGFLLLASVLLIASRQRLWIATLSALAATISYNFFFFPTKGTLTIDDPENWVALVTFLFTSLVANRLLVRERRQAEIAQRSRQEIEALYDLSLELLREGGGVEQIGEAARRYLERIGAKSGGVIRFGSSPQHQQILAWTGTGVTDEIEDVAAGVARHGCVTQIQSRFGHDVCLPLLSGGRTVAALVVRGALRQSSALQSAANLLALAIERERFLQERARVEALREADELKTSLLQAVSHDLRSPLTVLMVESEALERGAAATDEILEHVRTIRGEVSRLHRRITNLLSAARLEAGIASPRPEPTPPADLFRAARESLPTIAAARAIQTSVDPNTPDLMADPSLALEIIVNLIENAHLASPPDSPIELAAGPSADLRDSVRLEVRDRGPGLPAEQIRRVRVLDTSDNSSRGLGVELARTFAVLSGGSVEWFPREGGGTIARLELPSAPAHAEEAG